jgi:hypothetical protein
MGSDNPNAGIFGSVYFGPFQGLSVSPDPFATP